MNLAQLIQQRSQLQTTLDALDQEGRGLLAAAEATGRNLTAAENARSRAIVDERTVLRAQIADVDAQIVRASAPNGTYARTNEREATYTQRKRKQDGISFFTDMYRQQMGHASTAINERLQAHEREMSELQSQRAVSTGGLGGMVAPQYLIDLAAPFARAGRPTADVVRHLELPATGMSVIVPRHTTPITAAVQATQNTNVSNTDAVITDLNIPVVTIAGQEDISRQAIERGEGIDELIYADLVGAYNVALDAQVISGSGSGGQMLGILNTAGVTQMGAFTAAATAATFWSKFAGAVVAVQTGRFLAPSGVVIHPRRWGWLNSLLDSNNRPLVVPNTNGPANAQGHYLEPIDTPSAAPVGWFQGVPVYTDANIPTNVGAASEDQVIVSRLEDLLLWEENGGLPHQIRFDQTLGAALTVKLVAYGYAAFTAGRYPAATTVIGGNAGAGNGLIAPTF